MTPFVLKDLAVRKFGPERWLQGLAYATGVSERTIRRWASGDVPINGRVESHIRLACEGKPVTAPPKETLV